MSVQSRRAKAWSIIAAMVSAAKPRPQKSAIEQIADLIAASERAATDQAALIFGAEFDGGADLDRGAVGVNPVARLLPIGMRQGRPIAHGLGITQHGVQGIEIVIANGPQDQ